MVMMTEGFHVCFCVGSWDRGAYHYPHVMGEETEAQRGGVTHLGSHRKSVQGLRDWMYFPKTHEALVWKKPALEQGGTQGPF